MIIESKNKNHSAFEKLLGYCGNSVYSFIKLKIDGSDADDVYQETIFAVWKSLSNYDFESNFKTWCIGIAKNKIHDFFRRHYKTEANEQELAFDLSSDDEFDSIIDSIDIKSALSTLPESERKLLSLVYDVGLSYTQIEEITGMKSGTIKSKISRIKAKLLPLLS